MKKILKNALLLETEFTKIRNMSLLYFKTVSESNGIEIENNCRKKG